MLLWVVKVVKEIFRVQYKLSSNDIQNQGYGEMGVN